MSDDFERFQRAFSQISIDEVWTMRRAIVGPSNMPPGEQADLAKQALAALGDGKEPTPKQIAALELVVRMMRPSLLSKRRQIEPLPEEIHAIEGWDAFREAIIPKLYTIGRIDNQAGQGIGTGFLVSEKCLVTNRHVLDQLTGGIRRLERGQAKVYFKSEYQTIPDEPPFDIVKVVAVHQTLDLSIFEIDPVPLSDDRVLLAVSENDADAGDDVAVVGYPQKDLTRNPLFVPAIFGNRFGVKRVAPGEIISRDRANYELLHDCSTLGGNSGSPVVSLRTGQLVGVHSAGFFMLRNQAIFASALRPFVDANI